MREQKTKYFLCLNECMHNAKIKYLKITIDGWMDCPFMFRLDSGLGPDL